MTTTLLLEASDIRDNAHWYWRLTDAADGHFIADQQVVLDAADLRYEACCDLYSYLKQCAAADRRWEEETQLLQELGAWIGEQALGRNIVSQLMESVEQSPVTVRVQLPADSPAAADICFLPLELAHAGGKPLAQQDVSLVFEVGQPAPVKLKPVGDRLRMLAVFSLPIGETPLNLRQERYRLKKLIRELTAERGWALDLRVVQYGVTRQTLREMLEEGEGWDVAHFSGHGLAAEMVLEKPDGRPDIVNSEEFARLLRPGRERLKLVILSSCLSAAPTVKETLSRLNLEPTRQSRFGEPAPDQATASVKSLHSLAQTLVKDLNCAVLAMRYPVDDAFAIELSEQLYERLLKQSQPLPRALQLALQHFVDNPDPVDKVDCSPLAVVTPKLFGAAAVDLTFHAPETSSETNRPELRCFPHDERETFVGRVKELTLASQALAPESGRAGVLFYNGATVGKTYCALELVDHYRDLPRFRRYVWYRAPQWDKDISRALADFAEAMDNQLELPDFKMPPVVGRPNKFDDFLLRLTEKLSEHSFLLVLDQLESLLCPNGQWRDERWGKLVAALLNHRGLSRVILTSRIRPVIEDIPADALLELVIPPLTLDETALLARQSDHLRRLLRADEVTDDQQRERQAVREALRLAQGNPKLLDLIDKQATSLEALERRLEDARQAWMTTGQGRLDAFFHQGESALTDADFSHALERWIDIVVDSLPAAAQDLFYFLCCLEETDRQSRVVEPKWADFWRRLKRPGDPPALEPLLAALTTAGLATENPTTTEAPAALIRCYQLDAGVAETGWKRAAAKDIQTAVDEELAAYWTTVYVEVEQQEMQGAGRRLVHAAQAAAPYLLRRRQWEKAATLLEQALNRDDSPTTVAATLPLLEQIAKETKDAPEGLENASVLARALLKAGRWQEAEDQLRTLLDQAVQRQAFRLASGIAGELIDLLQATGRCPEALALVEPMQDYIRRAGLGPWTRLSAEGRRLQLLVELGRDVEALVEVWQLQRVLQDQQETSDQDEAVAPWAVRELIFNIGWSAAVNLKRWRPALVLNGKVLKSQKARHAPALEQAGARFNNYYPLLRLGRYDKARKVLDKCRAIYSAEDAAPQLGRVFAALADLEEQPEPAIGFSHTALRYTYRTGHPEDCAVGHFNLVVCQSCFDGIDRPNSVTSGVGRQRRL